MRGWLGCLALGMMLGCSGLDENEVGVVSLEVRAPALLTIETGEQLQLTAEALNADGDVVDAAVSWRSADPTVTIEETTGILTGVSPGTGRVQAFVGSLSSELLSFSVIARADTLSIVGDSIVTVPVEPGVTAPLVTLLQSLNPAGPVSERPVIYEIISPVAGGSPVVSLLPGGVQIDTLLTGTDGMVSGVTLSRVAGTTAPASAVVEVRASRTRGEAVPGSGQRFTINFQ